MKNWMEKNVWYVYLSILVKCSKSHRNLQFQVHFLKRKQEYVLNSNSKIITITVLVKM